MSKLRSGEEQGEVRLRDLPGIVRYAKGATEAQYDEAKSILEALDTAYPGHPWSVEIKGDGLGGTVFIRHLAFQGGNWGMNLKHTKNDTAFYSSSAFKREVILKAGEWLERAGIPRKSYDIDSPLINKIEGTPERKKLNMEIVMGGSDLRDTPRPQVLQEEEHGQQKGPGSSTASV